MFLILTTSQALSQEKTLVKVKSSELVTGVVIVHIPEGRESS